MLEPGDGDVRHVSPNAGVGNVGVVYFGSIGGRPTMQSSRQERTRRRRRLLLSVVVVEGGSMAQKSRVGCVLFRTHAINFELERWMLTL